MSKSNPAPNKTEPSAKSRLRRVWCVHLLLVCAFAIASQGVVAQQGSAVQPRSGTPSARKPVQTAAPAKTKGRVSEILVDASIPDDPALEKMLAPYSAKVGALEVVIGKIEGELKKGPVGGGNLGNFVADGIRLQSSAKLGKPVLLAVTNSGGLRKNTIAAGDLRAADIFELLPFENALAEVDLTGEQLLKLLNVVVSSGDALSGANIKYRMNAYNRPELVSVRLLDSQGREMEIDPKATYSIVTNDYLLKLGSGRYAILQEGINVRTLVVTLRNALMDYVKAETASGRPIKAALDDRFVLIGPDAQKPESPQR
ncbi:MAG: 5'-nucleotidase C-terminal domain-containing protein [Pyrinomonadaceae bacterium]|nr:5'-nucleotidase C-terminal domain-containing protein [Pyrinomonadaceae bacterium]MDQ3172610.1 5'-nucleotidase C-terminal domain-containing protein [Acidobacteriota bacterium]